MFKSLAHLFISKQVTVSLMLYKCRPIVYLLVICICCVGQIIFFLIFVYNLEEYFQSKVMSIIFYFCNLILIKYFFELSRKITTVSKGNKPHFVPLVFLLHCTSKQQYYTQFYKSFLVSFFAIST